MQASTMAVASHRERGRIPARHARCSRAGLGASVRSSATSVVYRTLATTAKDPAVYHRPHMSTSSSISVRIAAAALAISFGLFACEKGGTSTNPPDDGDAAAEGDDEGGEEPAEEAEEEDAGGW
jgi:hypothetical protein